MPFPALIASLFVYYYHCIAPAAMVILVIALVMAGIRILRRSEGWFADSFYVAWIVGLLVVCLVTPRRDERYLLPAYPAMIALGYLAIYRVCERVLPRQWAWYPAFALMLSISVVSLTSWPGESFSGVRYAAQFVTSERPARILYCGSALDGDFLAQLRSTNPPSPPIVVRADELPPEMRTPVAFDAFARKFGIDQIVLERPVVSVQQDDWRGLPTTKMSVEKTFPVFDHSRPSGELAVYRFTDPSPNPEKVLEVRSKMLGQMMNFDAAGGGH